MNTSSKFTDNNTDKRLDVHISTDGIRCVVCDDFNNVLLTQQLNIPINQNTKFSDLNDFFNQQELHSIQENVNIYIENGEYLLVPNELFGEEEIKKYIGMIFGKNEHISYKSMLLPKWNLHLVFLIPETINDYCSKRFQDSEIYHIVFKLLKSFIKRSEEAVYLHMGNNLVDIALTKDNKLQLLNSFQVQSNEDICYFTLNVYEQFSLNTEKFQVKIKRNGYLQNSTLSLLKKYITNIELVE